MREPPADAGGSSIRLELCFGSIRRGWTIAAVARAGWSEMESPPVPKGRAAHAVSAAQRWTTSRVRKPSNNLGPPPFSGPDSLPRSGGWRPAFSRDSEIWPSLRLRDEQTTD
jgi:hypothetical protein